VLTADHLVVEGNMIQRPVSNDHFPKDGKAVDHLNGHDNTLFVGARRAFIEEVNAVPQLFLMTCKEIAELLDLVIDLQSVIIPHTLISSIASYHMIRQLATKYEAH